MKFEITLGWWLVPVAVTIAAFVWHAWVHKGETSGGGYGAIGQGLGELITILTAIVVSLVAWLIWALIGR